VQRQLGFQLTTCAWKLVITTAIVENPFLSTVRSVRQCQQATQHALVRQLQLLPAHTSSQHLQLHRKTVMCVNLLLLTLLLLLLPATWALAKQQRPLAACWENPLAHIH